MRFLGVLGLAFVMIILTTFVWLGAFALQSYRCSGYDSNIERRIQSCNWLIGTSLLSVGHKFAALVYSWRGDAQEISKDFRSALASYQVAVLKDPSDAGMKRLLGQLHFNQERYDQAYFYYNSASKLDPGSDVSHIRKGDSLWYLERYSDAIKSYTRAIDLNTKFTNPYNARGWIYMKTGRFRLAEADFSMSIQMDDQDALTFYRRGWVYYKLGNKEKAESDYKRSSLLKPNHTWPRYEKIRDRKNLKG